MNWKRTLTLGLLAGSILVPVQGKVAQGTDLKSFLGKRVPDFRLVDTKGRTITAKSLRGKVVLLDFWATWCGPCKAASPTMEALHRQYKSRGLVVIGADAFETGDVGDAPAKYAREHHYTYTFTPKSDDLAKKLGLVSVPAFVLIDREGVVRWTHSGFKLEVDPPKFKAAVQKAI